MFLRIFKICLAVMAVICVYLFINDFHLTTKKSLGKITGISCSKRKLTTTKKFPGQKPISTSEEVNNSKVTIKVDGRIAEIKINGEDCSRFFVGASIEVIYRVKRISENLEIESFLIQ